MSRAWGEVFSLMEAAFKPAPDRGRAEQVSAFLDGLVTHIDTHPELLRLDALSLGVLKADLRAQERQAFTDAYDARLAAGSAILEKALTLPQGRGLQLLLRTHGLTRGLWRSFEELDATRAAVRPSGPFASELRDALAEYWKGAVG